jgi:uncharacterized protein YecT (DUF1311 family)
MTRSDSRGRALTLASLGWLLIASSCMGGEEDGLSPLSRSISGLWEVGAVSTYPSEDVDLSAAQAREPRIKHRLVRFSDTGIAIEGARTLSCASPAVSKKTLHMTELAAASFRGEMAMEVPFFDSDDPVDALYLHCAGKPLRTNLDGDGVERDVWMLVTPEKVYLRWYDGSVLWLDRVDESAPPQASFDCKKAQSPTENAICGSRSLASYDQSVGEAFESWKSQYATEDEAIRREREKIVASQHAWIQERNACGADPACLEKSMKTRIDAILAEVEKTLTSGG